MALPRVQPVVPTRRKEPFDHADWLFDVKYDGFRALCHVEPGRPRFSSRNGHPLDRFTDLAAEVASVLNVGEAILDGEVIVADATGRPQFYDLLRGRLAPAYVAFDLLWIDGVDLRPKPLSERRAVLRGAAGGLADDRRGGVGRGPQARALRADVRARPRRDRGEAARRSL